MQAKRQGGVLTPIGVGRARPHQKGGQSRQVTRIADPGKRELYLNGTKPVLGVRDFKDHNQRIRDDPRKVLARLAEHIVVDKDENGG
jgi:hypothetical protein